MKTMEILYNWIEIQRNQQAEKDEQAEEDEQTEGNIKDLDDDQIDEEITTRPVITIRGRVIKLPARFLFIAIIGILTPKFHTAANEEPTSNVPYSSDTDEEVECFQNKNILYSLLLFTTPYLFILIMVLMFTASKWFMSRITYCLEEVPSCEMIEFEETNHEEILKEYNYKPEKQKEKSTL